jgi:hypothetical protein
MIRLTAEIVELNGNLTRRVLYHVTSTFNFANVKLVDRGIKASPEP